MSAFLEEFSSFLGTGEKNELGQDLKSFLEDYDPKKYENPCVTVDTLVFRHKDKLTTVNKGLKLLMIKRRNHPCIGFWALPGGFVEIREDTLDAAKRELKEETGLTDVPMEQIYTWGEANRDPRARIITLSYLALVEEELEVKAGDDATEAVWMDVKCNLLNVDKTQDCIKQSYEIYLNNSEKKIELKGIVEVLENCKGLLKEKSYKVITSNGIAFDHARFIMQSLLYIEELIKQEMSVK
ncbi:8-oxo-dGTP diphosphatase [Mobilisporobacter senegalensis]|uniref:8-oxo-dGTP diphosphatase n=1 Tax=Mobilisporobacter senegalensis TaxID=1329262 RepID=A0A3N1XA97_9FIRM|nr:NUDIX hydrolase [Mobilisporobacter senegalensis]ROR23690.1 8-oxo-dGTP diphosphatase [Mobilisporobacter senegalensis]